MPLLNREYLDNYTIFLSKYGKYITDEIMHYQKIDKMIDELSDSYNKHLKKVATDRLHQSANSTADQTLSQQHERGSDDSVDTEDTRRQEKNAFKYQDKRTIEMEMKHKKVDEEQQQILEVFDEDALAQCLDDIEDDGKLD